MEKFDTFRQLLMADRTVRRFDSSLPVSHQDLEQLVELTRYCASGRNLQPLRYRLVTAPRECEELFPALAWAGYYKDWDGPAEGERPVAYLVQCLDTELTTNCMCDDGLQLQAITLGATAMGIAGCIIKSFNRKILTEVLRLPDNLSPLYVLALGYPAERVKIVDIEARGDYKYFRDETDAQCVPKRPLSELIVK